MAKDDEGYMGTDAKETLNVLKGLIANGKEANLREASVSFFQTHMNADSTQVSLRVRF